MPCNAGLGKGEPQRSIGLADSFLMVRGGYSFIDGCQSCGR